MSRSSSYPLLSLLLAFALPVGLHAQATPPDLSDPEVAHVAVTANSIDVDLAKLAQSRTHNKDVKQFATTMITDHSAVNAAGVRARHQARRHPEGQRGQPVAPQGRRARLARPSSRSRARRSTRPTSTVKWRITGRDRRAGQGPDPEHFENAELKQLLVDVRPAFEAHLEHAKKLQSTLVAGK